MKLTTLAALCTALECTPNDLFEVDTTPVERTTRPPQAVAEQPKTASGGGRSMPATDGSGRVSGGSLSRRRAVRDATAGGPAGAASRAGWPGGLVGGFVGLQRDRVRGDVVLTERGASSIIVPVHRRLMQW